VEEVPPAQGSLVDGERAKPSREVAIGERVEVRTNTERWTVDVRALADRRGPASAARQLYEETPESAAAREQRRLEAKASRPLGSDLGARPTKRDRRRLDALRRGQRRR
jgi:ribosome-associated heat shock protein Hsp15